MPFILICFLFYCGRTMASQEATPSSQLEESNALDLPSACDIRDYVLQKPCQEANSEDFSSLEAFSFPCSSEVDPDGEVEYQDNEENHPRSLSKLAISTSWVIPRADYIKL
ncbi:shieldin complex subunit 1 isoform X2 [Trichechus manatus latirostris]|uniref:Shieldin complex subunit 1 isoform X2 n=1 Tax=Trichechus manatus latirostris TaxID=127582 RepID=A0A2Y9RG02_TRIMA|nr:shieldin complex subunit 1 isoform X2 [Trichechus manatus latirostris]